LVQALRDLVELRLWELAVAGDVRNTRDWEANEISVARQLPVSALIATPSSNCRLR